MAVVRWILGRLILTLNWLFTPRGIKRSAEDQSAVDAKTANLSLYQYEACPFCVKVRRAMKRNSLKVEIRDAKRNETYKSELLEQGGKLKVPCLRIEENGETRWMYESSDIINFLEQNIAQTA
ncbi:glutathione S-transferase N-terminal domain-containing protein [Alkalimarinus sediminis]|uniref:Glutathione S-transferase N-terminal domain-containing protein n=1 Tax=Alkalimarinus sediminis TaxID=1632866 RepID=A0A9E8HIQ1_9ALTE|nr:glutathione S-transferase N-terminal domain-containing protein [Alkalimarinus sediminis]UZW74927.1 glutathione S-transferase N-terminal domain-containing protein [Alkalimarinus sediminis]